MTLVIVLVLAVALALVAPVDFAPVAAKVAGAVGVGIVSNVVSCACCF